MHKKLKKKKINFLSSQHTDGKHVIHSKSDYIETKIGKATY